MLCCPPLLEFGDPVFDQDTAVCMLDWQGMAAYSVTLAILVLGPSLITILYTYVYIYGAIRRLRRGFLAHDKVDGIIMTSTQQYGGFQSYYNNKNNIHNNNQWRELGERL
jgi:hypothetical protein